MKKETFKTEDQPLTEDQINSLATITKSDVDKAIATSTPELKEFLNAEIYKSVDRNYTLG